MMDEVGETILVDIQGNPRTVRDASEEGWSYAFEYSENGYKFSFVKRTADLKKCGISRQQVYDSTGDGKKSND